MASDRKSLLDGFQKRQDENSTKWPIEIEKQNRIKFGKVNISMTKYILFTSAEHPEFYASTIAPLSRTIPLR